MSSSASSSPADEEEEEPDDPISTAAPAAAAAAAAPTTSSTNTGTGSSGGSSMLVLSLREHLQKVEAAATATPPSSEKKKEKKRIIRLALASQSPRRKEILDLMGLEGRYVVAPSPLDESSLQRQLQQQRHEEPIVVDAKCYAKRLAEEKALALATSDEFLVTLTTRTTTTSSSSSPGSAGNDDDADDDDASAGRIEAVVVLGSDTVVELEGRILEKPVTEADARRMLSELSGRQHAVHTGVAIVTVTVVASAAADTNTKSAAGDNDNASSSTGTIRTVVELASSFVDTAVVRFAELTQADIDSYVKTGEPMDKAGAYGIQGLGGQFVESIRGDFFTVRVCVCVCTFAIMRYLLLFCNTRIALLRFYLLWRRACVSGFRCP